MTEPCQRLDVLSTFLGELERVFCDVGELVLERGTWRGFHRGLQRFDRGLDLGPFEEALGRL